MKVISLLEYLEKKELEKTIEDLPLLVCTYNFLKRNHILTLKELKSKKPEEIIQLQGVNQTILKNLEEVTGYPYVELGSLVIEG